MEKRESSWRTYHERTEERAPSESLVKAVKLVAEKDSALDLGAGALRDSKFLLQEGFLNVTAVDIEPAIEETASKIKDERLQIVVSSFQEFDFPEDSFDLINAQFVLPFMTPESFDEIFRRMGKSLKHNGVFVGQLFGKNDSWNGNPKMTFHNLEQVKELFSRMQVIELREGESDGTPIVGEPKHWHVFYITARK